MKKLLVVLSLISMFFVMSCEDPSEGIKPRGAEIDYDSDPERDDYHLK